MGVLTPANFTPSQCVKKCPLGFSLDDNLIQTFSNFRVCKISRGNLRTWLCRTYNLSFLTALLKISTQVQLQKRLIVFLMLTDFCAHCKIIVEAMGYYLYFCFCQEATASMKEEETQKRLKKRIYDELRRYFFRN